jgi:hypothetical protein
LTAGAGVEFHIRSRSELNPASAASSRYRSYSLVVMPLSTRMLSRRVTFVEVPSTDTPSLKFAYAVLPTTVFPGELRTSMPWSPLPRVTLRRTTLPVDPL